MCDVPSVAVACSESIEYFPGIVNKSFIKKSYYSGGFTYYWFDHTLHVPHSLYLYTYTLVF